MEEPNSNWLEVGEVASEKCGPMRTFVCRAVPRENMDILCLSLLSGRENVGSSLMSSWNSASAYSEIY